jgi:hypothetical protein
LDPLAKLLNELRITGTCAGTCLVVEVSDVEQEIASSSEKAKQRHTVRAAAHTDAPATGGDG